MSTTSERVSVSLEDAVAMIGEAEYIHTFRQGGVVLLGADWSRNDVIEAMKRFGVELSGDVATAMHHGLVLHDGTGHIFIETKRAE